MPFLPINPPPGMWANDTAYGAKGRWYDGSQVRWYNGQLRPIGGWVRDESASLTGTVRAILPWWSNDRQNRYIAVGAPSKCYINSAGSWVDVTPGALVAGREDTVYGLGWGSGAYGSGTYGDARTLTGLILEAATWSFAAWGQEFLSVLSSDGVLWTWAPGDSALSAIAGAPTDNNAVFVTDEAHVVLLGAGGIARRVQWSNRRDKTDWTAGATKTAGSFDLVTNGRLLAAAKTRGDHLLLTDIDAHLMYFVGSPEQYGFRSVGQQCGIIGPNAAGSADGIVYWMGQNQFFYYDGYVRDLPCDVLRRVFGDMNTLQGVKITCGHNADFAEITWFYPSAASTNNDRYVTFNYRDRIWYTGALARSAWVDKGVLAYPMAGDTNGYLYDHERGWTASGATRAGSIYAIAGATEGAYGDNLIRVNAVIPDIEEGGEYATFKVLARYFPNGPQHSTEAYSLSAAEGRMPVRIQGRQLQFRVDAAQDGLWRMGSFRVDASRGGKR